MAEIETLISEIYHKIPENEPSTEYERSGVENTRQEFMAFMYSSVLDEAKMWMRCAGSDALCDEYDAYAKQEFRMDAKAFQSFMLSMMEAKSQEV
tara:strand:+ start:1547 stop:1831 length:285 start_codon:yes stop_codon:yes gene_type:complete